MVKVIDELYTVDYIISKSYEFFDSDAYNESLHIKADGSYEATDKNVPDIKGGYDAAFDFFGCNSFVRVKLRDCYNLIEYQIDMYPHKSGFSFYIWFDTNITNHILYINESYNITEEEYFQRFLLEYIHFSYNDIEKIKNLMEFIYKKINVVPSIES